MTYVRIFFAWVCSCCSFFNSPANQGSRSGQEAIHENCKNQLMIHYSPVGYMKWYPCSIIQYPIIRITCLIMFQYQTPQIQIIFADPKKAWINTQICKSSDSFSSSSAFGTFLTLSKKQGNRPSWKSLQISKEFGCQDAANLKSKDWGHTGWNRWKLQVVIKQIHIKYSYHIRMLSDLQLLWKSYTSLKSTWQFNGLRRTLSFYGLDSFVSNAWD